MSWRDDPQTRVLAKVAITLAMVLAFTLAMLAARAMREDEPPSTTIMEYHR